MSEKYADNNSGEKIDDKNSRITQKTEKTHDVKGTESTEKSGSDKNTGAEAGGQENGKAAEGTASEEVIFAVPDCCRHKTRERSEKEYRDLLNRLSRIEGQVRGVRRMLENNAYCLDIITQVSAVNSALNSFNKVLLTNHLQTCVTDDIREGRTEKIEELVKVLPKLMK